MSASNGRKPTSLREAVRRVDRNMKSLMDAVHSQSIEAHKASEALLAAAKELERVLSLQERE